MAGLLPHCRCLRNELNSLPIRVIDFENPEERRIQAAIIRKVTELATLRAQYDGLRSERERGFTARRAAVLDEQLDELVAELYELTPEEAQYMSQMVARGERSRTF